MGWFFGSLFFTGCIMYEFGLSEGHFFWIFPTLLISGYIIKLILDNPGAFTKPTSAKTYTNGHEYEHYVAARMEEAGYRNVRVTKASGDFGADIIAYYPSGEKLCVQCKFHAKPVGISAVQEVIGARGFYGCHFAKVVSTSGFTPAAEKLAEKNNVFLETMR